MRKILFIDDDLVTHKLVTHSLGTEFEIIPCYNIAEATRVLMATTDLSAVIIDRGLPDGDGLSICFKMRQENHLQNLPIIFLSSAGAETDKVTGFFAGADDYITKPFSLLELKARVHARLRQSSRKIFIAKLEVDLNSQRAFFLAEQKSQEIDLTRTEFKILTTLIQSMDHVFHRDKLLSAVWGQDCNVTDRVVDSHISHLRKKVSSAGLKLESLRGEGYRMTLATPAQKHRAA